MAVVARAAAFGGTDPRGTRLGALRQQVVHPPLWDIFKMQPGSKLHCTYWRFSNYVNFLKNSKEN